MRVSTDEGDYWSWIPISEWDLRGAAKLTYLSVCRLATLTGSWDDPNSSSVHERIPDARG